MNETQTKRSLRPLNLTVTVAAVALWAIVVYYAHSQVMPRAQYGVLFLGGILVIFTLSEIETELAAGRRLHLLPLVASGAVAVWTTVYLFQNFTALNTTRVGYALPHEYQLATVFAVVLIYLTWRAFGSTFLVIVLGGIAYGYFGGHIPGVLGHGGMSLNRLLMILVLEFTGFYGFLTQLTAAWIALFLLYAGFLQSYGAYDLIFRFASRSTDYVQSGIAQTAVIASAVIGSINGSQTANAGMTGSFTIPLMKKNGMRSDTAAGIEAVASTSGQVLPPVMGAGAFVMASLLGIAYVDVLVAGLIPAIILVVTIIVAVHFTAINQLESTDMSSFVEGTLSRTELLVEVLRFGIPFAVLIYVLGIMQYTVMTAALYTALSMMITGFTFPLIASALESKDAGAVVEQAGTSAGETVEGLRVGALATAPIAIIMASINGVVDIFMTSGVPGAISLTLMSLSGGVLLVAAIMAMVICIIMGLGMPTTAAYTVVALLIAPTMITTFGLPDLAAHYFVFYAAILAGLTPPIATTAAVASGIAQANFWRTCIESMKISAPLFVLPFVFVYHPEIVSATLDLQTITLGGLVLVGAVAMIYGINYHFEFPRGTTYGFRALYVLLGVVVMVPESFVIRLGGLGGLGVLYGVQKTFVSPSVDLPESIGAADSNEEN